MLAGGLGIRILDTTGVSACGRRATTAPGRGDNSNATVGKDKLEVAG
jgi:hypothetical protein